ncbi:MAG: hypothetical protein K6T75_09110 [Acetobacteraceae bacterium]|nr:hypothetical protein [Acetobacteraceae bacterium]
MILAVWSRAWLGAWALLPVSAAVLWTFANPRIFPRPRSTNNWASKAVFGERVWLNRGRLAIPRHHTVLPGVLNAVSGAGTVLVVWGLYWLHAWPVVLGCSLVYAGKLWFLDRMVWLYEDMKHVPEYGAWLY